MSKTTNTPKIQITKRSNLGTMPMFIRLAHRSLEKSNPTGNKHADGTVRFPVATDLVELALTDKKLSENLVGVELIYAQAEVTKP